ncbi:MAG: hypothetical protein L6W00_11985 [Lentisphaeria bacterium]|nr:MAG: hypothetical protein L6W00_11985 [Lentisphaeria bacterium]
MQELIFYVNAASTLGVCRDSFDAKTVALPTIIRGGEVLFRMRLFSGNSPREQYPLEALQNVVSWEWNMDADYDEDTPCKLVADNSAITVGEVEEERDGTTTVYTEIQIPVSQTNTVELRDWLSSAESKKRPVGRTCRVRRRRETRVHPATEGIHRPEPDRLRRNADRNSGFLPRRSGGPGAAGGWI